MFLNTVQQAFTNSLNVIDLLYPNLCRACGNALSANEDVLCINCQHQLPTTDYHLRPDNSTAKQLWGRVPFENATSFLFFTNGSKVQHLIHQLKYHGKTQIGIKLGKMYGLWLQEVPSFEDVDMVLPVPLHPDKEKRRGYNQSFFFAMGLGESMHAPYRKDCLVKSTNNQSQTRKSRLARWENVKSVFEVTNPRLLEGKHVLLVDDVITTGSTLEACTHRLREAGARVSIATIACTV